MKNKLKVIGLILAVIILLGVTGLVIYNGVKSETAQVTHPVATFEIDGYGTVEMELYPEYAPNTVSNFIALIKAGYYNNKLLYGKDDICIYMGKVDDEDEEDETESEENDDEYVMNIDLSKDSGSSEDATNETTDETTTDVAEETTETATEETAEEEDASSYTTTMASIFDSSIEKDSDDDYEYEINGEFVANGYLKNTLRHEKGIISLNRMDYSAYGLTEESYNSGKASFSVMMEDSPSLNGVYCAFGKITNGLDIIEGIYNNCEIEESEEESDEDSIKKFKTFPVIKSASVETYGVDYGTPETHEAFDYDSYINQLYLKYYSSGN